MKQKGFTLIESLVSIAIIIILAGITLANYADIRTQAQVDSDLDIVVGALRNAQAEALAPEREKLFSSGLADEDRLCSLGVRFDPSTNQIQPLYRTVIAGLGNCNNPSDVTTETYGEVTSPVFTTFRSGSGATIFFDAPFGGVSSASTPDDPISIVLESNQDSELSREVLIYPSGIIQTQ